MIEPDRPVLAELKEQLGSLEADVEQMLLLRWHLARIEVEEAAGQIKRLAIAASVGGLMVLTALPLLLAAAAWELGQLSNARVAFTGWLLIFGFGLLASGVAAGWAGWRRFRRRFAGLEQSLEELREDAVWLRQWVAGRTGADRSHG